MKHAMFHCTGHNANAPAEFSAVDQMTRLLLRDLAAYLLVLSLALQSAQAPLQQESIRINNLT